MHRIALPFGAFTEHDQRVVARVGALVLEEQLDELVKIVLVLGDDTADGGCVGGIERRKAGIAAEDAKNANALMRADGSSLPLDRVAGAGDRRRESDAVLSIADVVVHRLRNANALDAEIIKLGRLAERVIA